MPAAEFEEREFETPLYNQLQQTNLVWSPGQVLEGHIGFDYAALCFDQRIWDIHGYDRPLDGVLLDDLFLIRHLRHFREPRSLPNFEINLFIQSKRPDHLKNVAQKLREKGIQGPYWRININPDQQHILETLAAHVGSKGLVCYAAAAFHRLSQLYGHIRSRNIVENSTFPEAQQLSGHSKWNYCEPGNVGVANVEPEFIEGLPLLNRLEALSSELANEPDEKFRRNLKVLANSVNACAEEASSEQEARAALFFQRLSAISVSLDAISGENADALLDFLTVQAFCVSFGVRWFTVGRKRYA
ncbi:hypothetical protein [Thioalkalivibrio thiocyanodenitrificans]|uniref:hypothetical protein n=1 Tax=Thioalkalivibrio thiocyanodenitrificans TaxID=243063 RepID=UPI0012EA981E|nr:hypothetical protein [Thioalkalivibrio thiocyanodenitrificans]